MEKKNKLRTLLNSSNISILGGAHDSLSARLVEEADFDGVWASGFGISLASHCLPDADLLTMSEILSVVRNMVHTVKLPVLADCDAGYGNAMNVMRLVREYERTGVAGICIEDNMFPKRCSLYENWKRELIPPHEMAGKLRAAKKAQQDRDFVVVARVEALIANHGLEEAIYRANLYADAGADAILIHSKEFAPLREFTQSWHGNIPLIVVPTLFNDVPLSELEQCGIRLVIYANQAVRAAMRAMRNTLQTIRSTGMSNFTDDQIVPLSEVYQIVNLDMLRDAEEEFLPHNVESFTEK
ncbi:phosphoenolpyruvate phosphomutase [Bacillus thuringiensis]|uniref:isocitrate lyase/PEP mutase family protein n=1 Tax=Bacillus thuringiensis TaxID=1428 RepID=UPI000BFB5332|nr:isocitrate lyase/PEP mutase family protein [Bacillus thuringiensis]PGH72149.1 phosphoenolpyruvate phosphomutase [Bacillus thuringiensis]